MPPIKRGHASLCIALILVLLGWEIVPGVWAQLPTATILGVVRDATGAVVPEVSLTARNVETGQTRTTVSAADGSYRLSALPVGSYELRVEHPGFRGEVRSGLTLTVAQEAVVNFTLQVGAVEQTIAVTAEAPLVDTTSGSLGGLVDEQRVADLPLNGRNYINLTLMQTGVNLHSRHGETAGSTGTWFSSNGATTRSNNYLLDGASMMTLWGASSASIGHTTLGVEGIREYRVITNSFSAEYGMTMGSQMVIVSKSGTNNFHGSLFEYLRNSALDARNFFDYKVPGVIERRLPSFTRNQFGGSVGGPIRQDKLFVYGVYEALRERLGVTTVSDTIPPAAKTGTIAPVIRPLVSLWPEPNLPNNKFTFPFSQPSTENYGQIRVDQTISANDSLFGRYTADDAEKINTRDWPQWRDPRTSRFQFATLSETRIFSPTLLNTARFSFSRTRLKTDTISGVIGPDFSFIPGQEVANITVGGITRFQGDNASPSHNKQNIHTYSDDLFYTRGRHSLKFGTLINRFQQYTQLSLQSKGNITFSNLPNFFAGSVQTYTRVTEGASRQERYYESTSVGFYVQDDLRLTSRVNLNLGLRYEFLTIPQEGMNPSLGAALRDIQHGEKTTLGRALFGENPSLRNFSPRFGFAWDVKGDGRTAVRGGFGLLYDINSPYGSAMLSLAAATPPFSSLNSRQNFPLEALPVVLPPGPLSVRFLDYHLQQSHILQYNLTVQRQLPFDIALTLAYAGSRGLNLMQHRDGNPTTPSEIRDSRKYWTGNEPRLNPNWGYIRLNTAGGNSWYNSFQFGLQKRLSKGLQFQSSYTWSKIIDETQGVVPNDSSNDIDRVDPTDRKVDRAPAGFDLLHNWRFNAIYRLPDFASGGVGKVLNGWWTSGILSLQGGYPVSVGLQRNRSRSKSNDSGPDRPDLRPGFKVADITHGVSRGCGNPNLPGYVPAGTPVGTWERWYDPCAFAIQPAGFLGNAGRNIIRGPGLANVDFSIGKDTALAFLGETGKLEFRAEFFNILNRVNLASLGAGTSGAGPVPVFAGVQPDGVENPLSNSGSIRATSTTSRQIQLALKILF